MKNLSIILFFALLFFIVSTEASRRGRSRNGRKPKSFNKDSTEKFRLAVEKYKKLREEKEKEKIEEENLENEIIESSSLNKREAINGMDEITRMNLLLLLGKHDSSHRKLFEMVGDSIVQNEYVLETVRDDSNDQEGVTNNLVQSSSNTQRKMAYKVKLKTVVKTYKKTIAKNVKTVAKTSKKVVTTTRKVVTTTIKKTSTVKKNTTTIKKASTTTRKITTTVKSTAPTNNSVPISSASSNINSNGVYQPKPGTKFQWQLSDCDKLNTSIKADVYDIDLFETPESKIKELKKSGKKVMCYFSGGTIESWREDAEDFLNKGVVLAEMEDWEDENWVNINSSKLKPLIQSRLDKAVEKGCDGVEIDNVDGYTFDENDFTYSQQLKFNKWLAEEAHKRKLSIGLKNDMDQIKDLLPYYDWALNEECYEYGECEKYKPFIQANKAVFGVSYITGSKKIAEACKIANNLKLDYQIKNLDLDSSKIDCSVYK